MCTYNHTWIYCVCQDQLDKQGFQKRDTAREWETRRKNSEKSEDQGPTPLQSEGAETESKPALFSFQSWIKEYAEIKLTHVAFGAEEQSDH